MTHVPIWIRCALYLAAALLSIGLVVYACVLVVRMRKWTKRSAFVHDINIQSRSVEDFSLKGKKLTRHIPEKAEIRIVFSDESHVRNAYLNPLGLIFSHSADYDRRQVRLLRRSASNGSVIVYVNPLEPHQIVIFRAVPLVFWRCALILAATSSLLFIGSVREATAAVSIWKYGTTVTLWFGALAIMLRALTSRSLRAR